MVTSRPYVQVNYYVPLLRVYGSDICGKEKGIVQCSIISCWFNAVPQYNPVPQRQTQQQMSTGNQQIPPQQQIPNVQVQSHPNQYPMITQTPAQDINAFQQPGPSNATPYQRRQGDQY